MIIPYKETPSEFEIQAYLYMKLKKKGVNVRGSVPNGRKRERGGSQRMVFDLVIFDKNNEAERIIEVKDSLNHRGETAQKKKYESTGYPVDYVKSLGQAKKYVRKY